MYCTCGLFLDYIWFSISIWFGGAWLFWALNHHSLSYIAFPPCTLMVDYPWSPQCHLHFIVIFLMTPNNSNIFVALQWLWPHSASTTFHVENPPPWCSQNQQPHIRSFFLLSNIHTVLNGYHIDIDLPKHLLATSRGLDCYNGQFLSVDDAYCHSQRICNYPSTMGNGCTSTCCICY